MKKTITILLCALLVLSLAGCGGTKAESSEPTAAPAAAETPAVTEAPAVTVAPDASVTPAESDTGDVSALVEQIVSMKGQPIDDLYALVGEPLSTDYTSSCIGPSGSKDGQLEYEGFTVYTLLLPDGTETIWDCE